MWDFLLRGLFNKRIIKEKFTCCCVRTATGLFRRVFGDVVEDTESPRRGRDWGCCMPTQHLATMGSVGPPFFFSLLYPNWHEFKSVKLSKFYWLDKNINTYIIVYVINMSSKLKQFFKNVFYLKTRLDINVIDKLIFALRRHSTRFRPTSPDPDMHVISDFTQIS